jgi:hypothetical protein
MFTWFKKIIRLKKSLGLIDLKGFKKNTPDFKKKHVDGTTHYEHWRGEIKRWVYMVPRNRGSLFHYIIHFFFLEMGCSRPLHQLMHTAVIISLFHYIIHNYIYCQVYTCSVKVKFSTPKNGCTFLHSCIYLAPPMTTRS